MNPIAQPGSPPPASAAKWNGVTTPTRRGGSGRLLGDVIVELGYVDRPTMDKALAEAHAGRSSPERVLLASKRVTEDQLSRAVAERFGLDHLDLRAFKVDPDAAKLVTPAAIKRYQAVPVSFDDDRTVLVAMADPANVLAVDDIAVMTGYEVRPAVASSAHVEHLLERLDDPVFLSGAGLPDLEQLAEPEPEHVPRAHRPAAPARCR